MKNTITENEHGVFPGTKNQKTGQMAIIAIDRAKKEVHRKKKVSKEVAAEITETTVIIETIIPEKDITTAEITITAVTGMKPKILKKKLKKSMNEKRKKSWNRLKFKKKLQNVKIALS